MIERKFVNQHIKEFEIKEYIRSNLSRVGLSDVKLQRTPLGEKVIISTSRPGLVVGRSGSNISKLTRDLKQVFNLENPQIEIEEVTSVGLDANIISEMIANSLERFGSARFKGIGHKAMSDVMGAGALGVEILISGKIPSARAKTWRFYQGYLKKCGDIAVNQVRMAYASANLKSGTIGIRVKIMTPDIKLPDNIKILKKEDLAPVVEEDKDPKVDEKLKEILADEARVEASKDEKPKKEVAAKKPRKPKAKKEHAAKEPVKETLKEPAKETEEESAKEEEQ